MITIRIDDDIPGCPSCNSSGPFKFVAYTEYGAFFHCIQCDTTFRNPLRHEDYDDSNDQERTDAIKKLIRDGELK